MTKFVLFASLAVATLLSFESQAADPTEPPLVCSNQEAKKNLLEGFALQKDHNTEEALARYSACLKLEPNCVSCLYEIGWTHWKMGEWQKVIDTWTNALKFEPKHSRIVQYLPTAKENLKIVESNNKIEVFRSKTSLMVESLPKDAPVVISFVGRWQAYNPRPVSPLDHYDRDIDSPKSASFSPDGKHVYVNSLEGSKTVVFNSSGLEKLSTISHRFKGNEKFIDTKAPYDYKMPKVKNPNAFLGKPVESISTHNGKYLWVPYYRRSFDANGSEISAMAVIDTEDYAIKRVIGTGPIAKYVQVSPDGKVLAVSNWGDNTVGLYDISGTKPEEFKPTVNLVVERTLAKKEMVGNRDKNCGFCVRGLAFTKDSKHLFVARMSKGGVAVFAVGPQPKYLGTMFGLHTGPRDLQIDSEGEYLYAGSNSSGFINKVKVKFILDRFEGKPAGSNVTVTEDEAESSKVFAGTGVRSIKLTGDGRYLFAAVNKASELQVYRTDQMKRVSQIPVDSYPVGLALSPDGKQAWVTSQGSGLKGGNSVGVYDIRYKLEENISVSKDPRAATTSTNATAPQKVKN